LSFLLAAFLIGVVCGLRALTGPAVVSWAAYLGWLHLENTVLAFLGYAVTAYILGLLAIVELVTDQLPSTPSRTVPVQFTVRVVTGAVCGAALGAPSGALVLGIIAGAIGGVVGTLGGYRARKRLAAAIGNDHPTAILEDVIAIGGALLIVTRF
jgi:uncharacterized membrane protein